MRRVVIVGNSGTGKTTLARTLAGRLDLPHVELDALYHQADWTPTPPQEFRDAVRSALDVVDAHAGGWVVCGNYPDARTGIWARADTIVWLDLPRHVVMARVLRRTADRAIRRTELWNGNRESVRLTFFSRHSILRWIVTDHGRRRRSFSALRASGPFAGKTWHVHRTPRETARWLASLQPVR